MPATNATLPRVRRDTPSVSDTNAGMTASGFTIVMSAANESSATLYSGISAHDASFRTAAAKPPLENAAVQSGGFARADLDRDERIAFEIDVPEERRARAAGHSGDGSAVLSDLHTIARE